MFLLEHYTGYLLYIKNYLPDNLPEHFFQDVLESFYSDPEYKNFSVLDQS